MMLTNQRKTEIAKTEPVREVKALSPFENEIRLSMVASDTNKQLKEMTATELLELSNKVTMTAYKRLGLKQKGYDMEEMQAVIFTDLRCFLTLTAKEVLLALKSGLDGDYVNDTGVFFNSSNFVQWLKRYVNGKRREVTSKLLKLEEREKRLIEPPPPTEAEQRAKLIEATNQYIDLIANNPTFQFIAPVWMLFEAVERFGLYTMPVEQKQRIYTTVKAQNKDKSPDSLKQIAREKAYFVMCKDLAISGQRFNENGQLIGKEGRE